MKNENTAANSTQMYITAQASCFQKSMLLFLKMDSATADWEEGF